MPLYDLKCSEGHTFERMIPLKDFEAPVECACGSPAIRLISAPMFSVENVGYDCPVTGKWISSKREHQENLSRTGCRILETGESDSNTARKAAEESQFDKMIEDTVEQEIEKMDSAQKETLHNELVNGSLDIAVERK